MTDEAEQLAVDVAGVMSDVPVLSDVDDDETVTVSLNWFDHPRREDTDGFSIGAVFGLDPDKWTEYLDDNVEPVLDHRKVGSGTTEIGTLTVGGDGEIVGHTVKAEFLKPSERD